MKIAKSTLPDNHSFNDFECSGKLATKDDNFDGTEASYLGSFNQSTKDSNKFYFGCVCQSNITKKWYVYCEWGRTGTKADYQFSEFESKDEALKFYKKQIESKNTKRGVWETSPIGMVLKPKPGKDLYLVRNMAVLTSNLPDSYKFCQPKLSSVTTVANKFDSETQKLIQDLKAGNISYTKSNFSSNFIPDIEAINRAKNILSAAAKAKSDAEKTELTRLLYSLIPKKTRLKEKVQLDTENIKSWSEDLDAFEDSFNNLNVNSSTISLKYELRYVDKSNQTWYNINRLVESATRNRHGYIPGKLKLLNVWEVMNFPDWFKKRQEEVAKEVKFDNKQVPIIFQPERSELDRASNTFLLFHGTRSCNAGGILSTGFRLPKYLSGVVINGANLGPGCYHASDWKKSAGYCSIKSGYWSSGSGTIANRHAFMFLNDVILGNPKLEDYPTSYNEPPKNHHSVIATTNGSFQNEEYVVYSENMFFPKYLLEFDL